MKFENVLGVDFSGAKNPGRRTWIASGRLESDVLTVETCERAAGCLDYDTPKDCYEALATKILDSGPKTVVGMDFPFGLPDVVVEGLWGEIVSWPEFVDAFPGEEIDDPVTFQVGCRDAAKEATRGSRSDLCRKTDAKNGALCPYGNYVYKQTYYGIGSVLSRLVEYDVAVEPMGRANNSDTVVVETYPTGTLARTDDCFATRYKGSARVESRLEHNVDVLCSNVDAVNARVVREQMEQNKGGDALDAVLAAYAASSAATAGFPEGENEPAVEGHIYV